MRGDRRDIIENAIKGATQSGIVASASAIASGLAIVSTPVKVLGLVTIGTTTAVSWPMVAGIGVTAAIAGGTTSAAMVRKRQNTIEAEFAKLTNQP